MHEDRDKEKLRRLALYYARVKYRDYQGRTNEGKACQTDSSGL